MNYNYASRFRGNLNDVCALEVKKARNVLITETRYKIRGQVRILIPGNLCTIPKRNKLL